MHQNTLVLVSHLPNHHFLYHFYRHNDLQVPLFPGQHYVFGPYDVKPLYYHKDYDYCDIGADDDHQILLNPIDCDDNGQDKQDDQTDSIPCEK